MTTTRFETNHIPAKAIEHAARGVGYNPSATVADQRREHDVLREKMNAASQGPTDEQLALLHAQRANATARQIRQERARRTFIKRGAAAVATVVGVGAFIAMGGEGHDGTATTPDPMVGDPPATAEPSPGFSQDAKTAEYVVQEGDNPWELAGKIEANQDSIKGNQDIRPIVDNITEQSNLDGNPVLTPGEIIDVPASADIYANVPGAQLDHK